MYVNAKYLSTRTHVAWLVVKSKVKVCGQIYAIPERKSLRYSLDRMLGRSQNHSGGGSEGMTFCLARSRIPTVQPSDVLY